MAVVSCVKSYPALDIRLDHRSGARGARRLLARPRSKSATSAVRVFFATAADRDAARSRAGAASSTLAPIEVSDEDWARRSQQNLTADHRRRHDHPRLRFRNPESRPPNPGLAIRYDRDRALHGLRHRPSRHDPAVPGGAADARPRGRVRAGRRNRIRDSGDRGRAARRRTRAGHRLTMRRDPVRAARISRSTRLRARVDASSWTT